MRNMSRLKIAIPNTTGYTFFFIGSIIFFCSVLFSKKYSKACSARSSSMDAFVTVTLQKKERLPTLHEKEIEKLRQFVEQGKNVFVCGATGTGKTFVVDSVLNVSNCLEIQPDNVPKKLGGNTRTYTLIDGYDSSVKHLVDERSRRLVVTATEVHLLPNFELIVMPRRPPDVIATLAPDSLRAAVRCNGNIRNFFDYLNFSDDKDTFKTSKEIVTDILAAEGSFNLSQTVHEHGHVCDVIHGNYLSIDGDHPKIADALSVADVYDTLMYKGGWEFMPYYVAAGIATPKLHMASQVDPETIRPGSAWTKYGNFKMRQHKLKNIQNTHSTQLGHDELGVIRMYAASGNLEQATDYGLQPGDFDVMNHLALGNKMKPGEVMRIKKKMRHLNNEL